MTTKEQARRLKLTEDYNKAVQAGSWEGVLLTAMTMAEASIAYDIEFMFRTKESKSQSTPEVGSTTRFYITVAAAMEEYKGFKIVSVGSCTDSCDI